MDYLAYVLKRELDQQGLHAADLSRMTGIAKSSISEYLQGKHLPRIDKLRKICFALGLPDPLEWKVRCYTDLHYHADTRLYSIWRGMKMRCGNPNNDNYRYYGAKGVSVCAEWLESFVVFEDWALAHGYRDDLTLDRIDPYGNYEPTNCRWATYEEQAANKRAKA